MSHAALALALMLAGAQPVAAASPAKASPASASANPGPAMMVPPTAAEKLAILNTFALKPDARGLVENECGEKVAPKFVGLTLGAPVGDATLLVIEGGPNAAACYGDGPDLHVMKREAAGFREIFAMRGGMMIIMPARAGAARDIAWGGPGFSFPLWRWNGTVYAQTRMTVSDKEIERAVIYP